MLRVLNVVGCFILGFAKHTHNISFKFSYQSLVSHSSFSLLHFVSISPFGNYQNGKEIDMKWQSDFYPDKLLVLRSLGRCQHAGTQKLLRGIAQRIQPISCTQPKLHHSQFTVALPFLSLKFVPLLLSQLLFLKMSTFDIDLILYTSPSLRNVCVYNLVNL